MVAVDRAADQSSLLLSAAGDRRDRPRRVARDVAAAVVGRCDGHRPCRDRRQRPPSTSRGSRKATTSSCPEAPTTRWSQACRRTSIARWRLSSTARFPPHVRCEPKTPWCWQNSERPKRVYAFSFDGIYDKPAYSRRVTGIDFSDAEWQRLGFVNELDLQLEHRSNDDVSRGHRRRGLHEIAPSLAHHDAAFRDVQLPGGLRRQPVVLAGHGAVGRIGARASRPCPTPNSHAGRWRPAMSASGYSAWRFLRTRRWP